MIGNLELCQSIWRYVHPIESCQVHEGMGRVRSRIKEVHKREFGVCAGDFGGLRLRVEKCTTGCPKKFSILKLSVGAVHLSMAKCWFFLISETCTNHLVLKVFAFMSQ